MLAGMVLCLDESVILRTYVDYKRAEKDERCYLARRRHVRSVYFNLNIYNEEQSLKDFRFRTFEVGIIAQLIGFTGGQTERSEYYCDDITAACVVMRRLAAPCRWHDLETTFGLRVCALSEVFWEALETFIGSCADQIEQFREDLMQPRAARYAELIQENGAALDNCVGFIDCTKIQMQRPGGPGLMQRSVYSGHKRMHCLIYQTVCTPDGLIFHMYGPEAGRRHDLTLYRQSHLDDTLHNTLMIEDTQYCLYGDPAYVMRPWLQVGYDRAFADDAQLLFNRTMSSAREAVEWSYKDLKQMWTSQDFKRMLKVRKAPISLMYKGAALLWNYKVCLGHGGQTQNYFDCQPPSLNEYTANIT